jgi:hypothetical protein
MTKTGVRLLLVAAVCVCLSNCSGPRLETEAIMVGFGESNDGGAWVDWRVRVTNRDTAVWPCRTAPSPGELVLQVWLNSTGEPGGKPDRGWRLLAKNEFLAVGQTITFPDLGSRPDVRRTSVTAEQRHRYRYLVFEVYTQSIDPYLRPPNQPCRRYACSDAIALPSP